MRPATKAAILEALHWASFYAERGEMRPALEASRRAMKLEAEAEKEPGGLVVVVA